MSDVLLDVITPTEAFWRMLGGNWQTDIPLSSPWNFEMQGMTHGSFSDHGTGSFCFDDVVKINAEYVQKGLQDCNEVWYNKETSPCDAPCDTVREHRP